VAAILEDKNVDSMEVDVNLMEVDRVPLRKAPDNVRIVDVAITSPKSAGRNFDIVSGRNYLILVILLPRIVLLRVLHLLFLALSWLYCRRRSMMTLTARILSERSFNDSCICFRYARRYCFSLKALDIRLRRLISHDRY